MIKRLSNRNRWVNPAFLLLLLISLLAFAAGRSAAAPAAIYEEAGITLLQADGNGVRFEVVSPDVERTAVETPAGTAESISLAGYGRIALAGQPDLPQQGVTIALPPGATASVRYTTVAGESLAGVTVAPLREQALVSYDPTDGQDVPEFEPFYQWDAAVYDAPTPFPATAVAPGGTGWLRGQRVATILVRPVQYDPIAKTLTHHRRLVVNVTFNYPDGVPSPDTTVNSDSPIYEAILAAQVLNYEQGRAWRGTAPLGTGVSNSPQASPCLDGNAYRLTLKEEGLYRLTHAALAAAGFPASVAAAGVRLCHLDGEVDITLDDADSNGNFNAGDAILFYGAALLTQETVHNVYWLTYGGAAGARMSTANATPGGAAVAPDYAKFEHLESNLIYLPRYPMSDDNDHWYYNPIAYGIGGTSSDLNIPFNVSDKAAGSYNINISAELWGHNLTDLHNYEVRLNGVLVGSGSFTGNALYSGSELFTGTINSSALNNGANTLTIRATDNGGTHLITPNWAEITYRRNFAATDGRIKFTQESADARFDISGLGGAVTALDITDPTAPVRLTGVTGGATTSFQRTAAANNSYILATDAALRSPTSVVKDTFSNWRNPNQQADYIFITDPSLNNALTPLVNRRAAQGLSTAVVYVQDIFDEFNYGIYDSKALQSFLAFAYTEWQSPPTYVMLVGDGTYDHKDYSGANVPGNKLVPVWLESGIDSNWGETAADNRYVAVTGSGLYNNVADMLLGRLPVLNAAELTTIVNKIVAYETAPDAGWQQRHAFLVDNAIRDQGGTCVPDQAGDFFATADSFLDGFMPLGQAQHLTYFAPPLCFPEPRPAHYVDSPSAATERFTAGYVEGNQFVHYIGHSAIETWGHEHYLSLPIVSQLANGSKTPIMLPMTCLEGLYQRPGQTSVAEDLLKSTIGGSVASYSPTGLQVQQGHDFLQQGFYEAVFDDQVTTLGQAVFGAKWNLETGTNSFEDLQDTFMLLGDPALQLSTISYSNVSLVPVIQRP